jgi:carbonic anhydrase
MNNKELGLKASMETSYKKLLLGNKAWVKEKLEVRPDYFERTAKGQSPQHLWIGCADSRVPANDVTGVEPGDLFVHRNIANLFIETDLNIMSVVQYAVEVLKVKHVIVCGHYECGGIKHAMSDSKMGLIDRWLDHIREVYLKHQEELSSIESFNERYKRLVELNAIEQVRKLAATSIIQNAWKHEQKPYLHSWIYDLHTGYLKDIFLMKP